jgi:hypothetical protein
MRNWIEYCAERVPPRLRRQFGEAFVGIMATTANLISRGAAEALRASWIAESSSPDDALPFAGSMRNLLRYAGESAAAYRARLLNAWNTWQLAGDEQSINGQIAAAGLNGSVLFQPGHPGPNQEPSYWSQFWITTTHSDDASLNTIRAIVKKWKPVQWIFRGFILTGFTAPIVAIGEDAVGEHSVGG